MKRIGTGVLDALLSRTVALFDIDRPWLATDGTGHSCSRASMYYAKKLKKQTKRRRKHYTKNSITVDTDRQVILAQRVRKGPRHDSVDAITLIRKTKRLRLRGHSLDKGYDCESIHRAIREGSVVY